MKYLVKYIFNHGIFFLLISLALVLVGLLVNASFGGVNQYIDFDHDGVRTNVLTVIKNLPNGHKNDIFYLYSHVKGYFSNSLKVYYYIFFSGFILGLFSIVFITLIYFKKIFLLVKKSRVESLNKLLLNEKRTDLKVAKKKFDKNNPIFNKRFVKKDKTKNNNNKIFKKLKQWDFKNKKK